jgi:branched-chain amino acid transport system substrate-binding protein
MSASSESGVTRREFVVTGGAAVAGLVVGGIGGYALAPKDSTSEGTSQANAGSAGEIHIGGAYPLTGALAGDGADGRHGAEMAIAEINAAGGILGRKVVLDVVDLEDLSADKVVSAFQSLINKKVSLMTMPYADAALAEFPVIAKSKIPFFHADTLIAASDFVAEDLANRNNIFQIDPSELPYGSGLVNYLTSLEESGAWVPEKKTVAIIQTSNPYALNIAKAFKAEGEKAGWKVILEETVNPPLAEWGPVLAKIRQNPPDLIMNLDYYMADLASFTQQFVASPTQSLLFEQYGPSVPAYLDLAKDAANGVLWSTDIGLIPDAIGDDWSARYEKMYDAKPGLSTAPGQYDAIMLYRQAVSAAGDPEDLPKVNAEIAKTIYRGVCGGFMFNPENLTVYSYPGTGRQQTMDAGLGQALLTFQIQDLNQVLVGPDPYTKGQFQMPPWMK